MVDRSSLIPLLLEKPGDHVSPSPLILRCLEPLEGDQPSPTLYFAKIWFNPIETSSLISSALRVRGAGFPQSHTRRFIDKTPNASKIMPSHSDASNSAVLPAGLDTLPGEVLTKILTFTMASDTPVYFWLYLQSSRNREYLRAGMEESLKSQAYWFQRSSRSPALPANQVEHHSDWCIATSVSRRMRESGVPAFFRHKTFIVPPDMLADLQESKIRVSIIGCAVDRIENIMVPIDNFTLASNFIILPRYHHFTRLKTLTIQAGSSVRRILDSQSFHGAWSIEPTLYPLPEELLDMLARLGLRLSETELRLVARNIDVSEVDSLIKNMERNVYPFLRLFIWRRAESEDLELSNLGPRYPA